MFEVCYSLNMAGGSGRYLYGLILGDRSSGIGTKSERGVSPASRVSI
jgi:hypothetical protein